MFFFSVGSPIGFFACVGAVDLVNLGDKHTIIFDKVITNEGSAYHEHTGVFTAPVKGLYVFHLSAMATEGRDQYLSFMVDGNLINGAYPDGHGTQTYQTTGSHWVLKLWPGSEVWVQTGRPNSALHGNCFSAFSGFLLYELQ